MNYLMIALIIIGILFVELSFLQGWRHYAQVNKDTTITYWASYKNLWGAITLWWRLIVFRLSDWENNKVYVLG